MTLILLFITGLVAGLVDAIAGGGGLITVPVLLSTGMSPSVALGTNKLQSSVGTLMAVRHFHGRGFLSFREFSHGLCFCAIGALLGASTTTFMNPHFFKLIVPYLLFSILAYMMIAPRLNRQLTFFTARMAPSVFYFLFGVSLGFYDGFFGPGTGAFWMFAFMFFMGFDILKATAHTKLFNLTSNLVALAFFIVMNCVDYRVGFCMAAGQWIGGSLGARLAIYKGAQLIRPLFLTMVFATIVVMVRAG